MTMKNLESLVLRGVRVLTDVRMGLERNGSYSVVQEPTAISLSFARHLFPSDSQADANAGTRWVTPCSPGGKPTAYRAGRPVRSAGVLDSRCPARFAGQAVLSGRQLVLGLWHVLSSMHRLTGSLSEMQRPTLRGSLICSPRPTGVKNRIPPVRQQLQQLQQPYAGNFTTY
jgi:hypothetical protein